MGSVCQIVWATTDSGRTRITPTWEYVLPPLSAGKSFVRMEVIVIQFCN